MIERSHLLPDKVDHFVTVSVHQAGHCRLLLSHQALKKGIHLGFSVSFEELVKLIV